jgi:hypothetical protein
VASKCCTFRHRTSLTYESQSSGFRTFAFYLQIPYYALREHREPREDRRTKDGNPLRRSYKLPLLGTPNSSSTSASAFGYLYEAQTSIVVTGFDDHEWSAYAAVDNFFDFFDTSESVKYYHEDIQGPYRPDPIAAGRFDANKPLLKPREYFLMVAEIRIQDITKEWHLIVRILKKAVEEYVFGVM